MYSSSVSYVHFTTSLSVRVVPRPVISANKLTGSDTYRATLETGRAVSFIWVKLNGLVEGMTHVAIEFSNGVFGITPVDQLVNFPVDSVGNTHVKVSALQFIKSLPK